MLGLEPLLLASSGRLACCLQLGRRNGLLVAFDREEVGWREGVGFALACERMSVFVREVLLAVALLA